MADRQALEWATGRLFGSLWAPFNEDLFEQSVALFRRRLDLAGVDPASFAGKTCLDAGCGGGRNSIAMARMGAKAVRGIDLGEEGLANARHRATLLGHHNVQFEQASILEIPAADATFDLVWCAGVLMITDDAERALDELTRVLKPGGKLYLLVYASGGMRWPLILLLRPLAALIGLETMEEAIVAGAIPANKRRTFLDDLYCPRLDFYEWPRLRRMLEARGMTSIDRWGDHVRLDHEHDLTAYRADLSSLRVLFAAGLAISSGLKRDLFEQGTRMIDGTLASIDAVVLSVSEDGLTEQRAKQLVIGQGHHRVFATRELG
jgi:SAM-dependent methyltransferase